MNTENSWVVTLSRHRSEFTALVENKEQLKSYLSSTKSSKDSAISLLPETRQIVDLV